MPADLMSDDITIPRVATGAVNPARSSFTHSYRARRTGMDTTTRRLFMAAAALGLLLLAGMAAWTFGNHSPPGVPVIEADSRPLRVKPENAGGMTVAGANDPALGHGDGTDLTADLAPEAERPDPQALRAQRAVVTAPGTTTSGTIAPPITPAASPGAGVVIPTPAVVRPPSAGAGTAMVQVAALDSEAGAAVEWQRLAHKAPDLLGDRKPNVVRFDHDGKTFWRLRTGGFTDIAAATEFCRKLRAKALACSIAS